MKTSTTMGWVCLALAVCPISSASALDIYVDQSSLEPVPIVINQSPQTYVFPGLQTELHVQVDGDAVYEVHFPAGLTLTARHVCNIIQTQIDEQSQGSPVKADAVRLPDGQRYVRLLRAGAPSQAAVARRDPLVERRAGSALVGGVSIQVLDGVYPNANGVLGFDTDLHEARPGSGTAPGRPWPSLPYAIIAAAGMTASSSGAGTGVAINVNIEPGQYFGDLKVPAGDREWLIRGTGGPAESIVESDHVLKNGIIINNGRATLENLAITGRLRLEEQEVWPDPSGPGGIQALKTFKTDGTGLYSSGWVLVDACEVYGNEGTGIALPCAGLNAGVSAVRRSDVHDNEIGVEIAHGLYVVEDNAVHHNGWKGLSLFCGSMGLVRNNRVYENGWDADDEAAGLWIKHHFEGACHNNPLTAEIDGNSFVANHGAGIGMDVSAGTVSGTKILPVIHNNIIAFNVGIGVRADPQDPSPPGRVHRPLVGFSHPILFQNLLFGSLQVPVGGPEWPAYLTADVLVDNLGNLLDQDPWFVPEYGDAFYLCPAAGPGGVFWPTCDGASPAVAGGGRMRPDVGSTHPTGELDHISDNIDLGYHHR